MSTKTEYLQKYVGEKVKKKKLRKKPKVAVVQPRIHIIDDDINVAAINQDSIPESEEELGEEAPQIADIVDESSKSIKMNSTKWRTIENVAASNQHKRLDSDSDLSPPRHQLDNDSSSQHKQSQERKSDSDLSPPRSNKHSDLSKRVSNNDTALATKSESNPRKRLDSDSDLSPPRHQLDGGHISRNQLERKSDSDLSPPRSNSKHSDPQKRVLSTRNESNHQKRLDSDSDLSPPRRHSSADQVSTTRYKRSRERNSDSDLSPPRSSCKHNDRRILTERNRRKSKHKSVKLEKKSMEKPKRIGDKEEKVIAVIEQKEEEKLASSIDKSVDSNKHLSGNEGSCNLSLDGEDPWVPEIFKPLARYKDDPELDEYLKKQERSGDTMLAYIRSKQKKEPSNQSVPVYKGPPPPPNRFNIQPGHRWDGVDRSNGFEKRYFDLQAKKKSQADLAYKWSVENM